MKKLLVSLIVLLFIACVALWVTKGPKEGKKTETAVEIAKKEVKEQEEKRGIIIQGDVIQGDIYKVSKKVSKTPEIIEARVPAEKVVVTKSKEIEKLEAEVKNLKEKNMQLEKALEEVKPELIEKIDETEQLEAEIAQLQEQIWYLQRETEIQSQEDLNRVNAEIAELKNEIQWLESRYYLCYYYRPYYSYWYYWTTWPYFLVCINPYWYSWSYYYGYYYYPAAYYYNYGTYPSYWSDYQTGNSVISKNQLQAPEKNIAGTRLREFSNTATKTGQLQSNIKSQSVDRVPGKYQSPWGDLRPSLTRSSPISEIPNSARISRSTNLMRTAPSRPSSFSRPGTLPLRTPPTAPPAPAKRIIRKK